MPRVYHVKKARKKNPVVDVGESYFWWKHAFGPKQFSKTRPKASQVTGSAFLSTFYGLQEELEAGYFSDFESLEAQRDELVTQLQDLHDECESSLENMPEHLQDTSESGVLLTERIDELDSAIGTLEGIDVPEEPSDWSDEIEDYEDMNPVDRGEIQELWKRDQMDVFVQEVQDNMPQL